MILQLQLSFINQQVDATEFEKTIDIPSQDDDFNEIREEYKGMLKNQLAKGNNGLVKTKYITFGIEAEDLKIARPRLERIEADVLNNFKVLGAQAHSLNGCERLEIMYHIFNQDRIEPFRFEYKMLPETGMKTKDFIAPTSFNFTKKPNISDGKDNRFRQLSADPGTGTDRSDACRFSGCGGQHQCEYPYSVY